MTNQNSDQPTTLALIGAGIFARDAYLPLFRQHKQKWVLSAVWSRSSDAVARVAHLVQEICPDSILYSGDEGLQEILQNPDIKAVLVCLPVQAALQTVDLALKAGKHVLCEKPIAPSLSEAIPFIQSYRANPALPVWGVAENYRSERVFVRAKELVSSLGSIVKIDLVADFPISASNKYFDSSWRRDSANCPGGFVTDVAVHFVAAIRTMAQAAGWGEVRAVSARSSTTNPALPPPDSLVGHLNFKGDDGMSSISLTFASHFMRFSLCVVGAEGSVEIHRGGWHHKSGSSPYVLYYSRVTDPVPIQEDLEFSGIEDEIDAFLAVIHAKERGIPVPEDCAYRIAPEEGARDLAVVEALLESCSHNAVVVDVSHL